jgi:hypothetical protein
MIRVIHLLLKIIQYEYTSKEIIISLIRSLLMLLLLYCFLFNYFLLQAMFDHMNSSLFDELILIKYAIFLCLLNALVHRTHPLSSPKNLREILVPIYYIHGRNLRSNCKILLLLQAMFDHMNSSLFDELILIKY